MNETPTALLDLESVFASSLRIDRTRQIYVNRNLNLAKVDFVGFDMDYTLAKYDQPAMDKLSVAMTVQKLIERHGFPEEIRDVRLDFDFIIRGLMVDKQEGNVFKLNGHNYVGRCYHGYRPVTKERRKELYRGRPIQYGSPRFAWLDTLFALSEATLMAGIIEHYEGAGRKLPWTYQELFDAIRASIDEAHRDDTLKQVILADVPGFVDKDPTLGPTLHKLRSAGKRLFLLTNSEWHYTRALMSYLLDDALPFYKSWTQYFDWTVVSARKPGFFIEEWPFLELDPDGRPLGEATELVRGRVYQGGNLAALERMTGMGGDVVLYVGDHIYGDILRTKKRSAWRTALVVQEMEAVVQVAVDEEAGIARLHTLEAAARRLDHEINHHGMILRGLGKNGADPEVDVGPVRERYETCRALLRSTLHEMEHLAARIDRRYNPYWGCVFREGNERSRFGAQVDTYADVYTSRVTNLLAYSPIQYFRALRELMPHERAG